jgi:hypothetical protein
VKFSRGGGGGRHAAEDPRRSGRHAHQTDDDGLSTDDAVEHAPLAAGTSRRMRPDHDRSEAFDGPYDLADAPPGVNRFDFGSIQVPSVDDVEIRVQDTGTGVIQQVVLTHGGSALLLVVFAAPKTEAIWDEVRSDFRESLFNDGVAVEEVEGHWGRALRARVRSPEGMMDLRFVGIDGPRWMLRAVFQGPAAVDPDSSGPLVRSLRGLVINRGRDAMPAKEALPLTYPREHLEAMKAAAAAAASAAAEPPSAAAAPPVGGSHRAPDMHVNGSAGADRPTGTVYGSSPEYGSSPFDTGSPFGAGHDGGNVYGSAQPPTGTGTYSGGRNGNGAALPDETPVRRRPSPRPRRSE